MDKSHLHVGLANVVNSLIRLKICAREKTFTCRECSQQFIEAGNLTRQMKIHRGEKLFVCSECSKQFTTADSL